MGQVHTLPIARAPSGYAALWVKSNFSFLEGASHPEELVATAHARGLAALALTDRDGVYGSVRAHVTAGPLGLSLIHGAQISVGEPDELLGLADLDGRDPPPRTRKKVARRDFGDLSPGTGGPRPGEAPPPARPVVVLATSRAGYANLCRLISRGRLACPKGHGRVRLPELAAAGDDLIALCPEPDMLPALREPFAGRLFALVARHRVATEVAAEARLRAVAGRLEVPTIAAVEVLYHDAARRPLQDVMTCIRLGRTLAGAGAAIRGNAEHALPTIAAMQALFADDPAAVTRTLEVAARCKFSLAELRYRYPAEAVPAGASEGDWLRRLTMEGAKDRYGEVPLQVRAQLERELALIAELDYGGYFLTMWDIVQFCKRTGILCQGRGSAANSAVCYCLGITAIDPVRMDLLFERFISRERAEPPDIDLDIEHERREEVIQYVYQRYGRRRAAMVAMLARYRPRSAVREVGKALGVSQSTIDRVAKLQNYHAAEIDQEMVAAAEVDATEPLHAHWLRLSGELLNFPRHVATHPGGFLLGHEPIDSLVPIEPAAMAGRTIVQWDKHDVEDLGLFKVDLLGLGALHHVHRCFDLIQQHHGRALTMATVPAEDAATYAMLSRGESMGVFQVESRAQMAMLPRLRPKTFYDLVIEVAIVRPGPNQGGMVHPFLRRRNGQEPVEMPHPSLERVLGKTLGVPLFQEQVMRLAMLAADYTPGEADQLRRDMSSGFYASGRIEPHHQRIVERMKAKGIEAEFAERVFAQIRGFGEYGFPESHAASFALIAYVTAWLRCHYPAAFTAALLNAQPMGFYQPATLVAEAQQRGLEIRPLDVQRSGWDCSLEPRGADKEPAVRMGLKFVRGLGLAEQAALADAPPPYADLAAFVKQTHLSRTALQSLAEAGALECFGVDRRTAIWRVRGLAGRKDTLLKMPEEVAPNGQQPLFVPLSAGETVAWDYRRAQHSTRGHPMGDWRPALRAIGIRDSGTLRRLRDGTSAEAVGIVTCRQAPPTAKGVTFLTLEDEAGMVNVVVWADVRARHEVLLRTLSVVGVSGKIQSTHGVVHLVADALWDPRAALRSEFVAAQ